MNLLHQTINQTQYRDKQDKQIRAVEKETVEVSYNSSMMFSPKCSQYDIIQKRQNLINKFNYCYQKFKYNNKTIFHCKMKKQELFAKNKQIILQIQKNQLRILKKIKTFYPIYKTFEIDNIKIKSYVNDKAHQGFKIKNRGTKKYLLITFQKQSDYLQVVQLLKIISEPLRQFQLSKNDKEIFQRTALTAQESQFSQIASNSQDISSQLYEKSQFVNEFLFQQPSSYHQSEKIQNSQSQTDFISEIQDIANRFNKKSVELNNYYSIDLLLQILNAEDKWNPKIDNIEIINKIDDNCFIYQKTVQLGYDFHKIKFIRRFLRHRDTFYIYDTTKGLELEQGKLIKLLPSFLKKKEHKYERIVKINCNQKILACYQHQSQSFEAFSSIETVLALFYKNTIKNKAIKIWQLDTQ